nr:integrase, catalytic region, zinc finger, CCHC-type, peptidase aspartic, catalytic [Tanacetum cinerariifolium]
MANLLEDIQCTGSDTRPPMLDKTDFASWQQRIRLYCRGKENGVNILKSIDEGPFQMGTVWEPLAEGTEGAPHLGPKRPRVYSDLSPEEKDRYNAEIRATNILLQRLPKDIYILINHYTNANDIWDNVKMLLEGNKATVQDERVIVQDLRGRYNVNNQRRRFQRNNAKGFVETGNAGVLDEDQFLFLAGEQVTNFDDDVDDPPKQDLALNVDRVFEADQCDAFDSDVDETPMTQTMFMVNLSFEDPIYDEAGPSYDSDIPSDVQDHDKAS